MSFTGKATYSAGSTLPEISEDVSDIISIVSPYETPLLDYLGDPRRVANSTYHEWIENAPKSYSDVVSDSSIDDDPCRPYFRVANPEKFKVGDYVQPEGGLEVIMITGVDTNTKMITCVREYGGSELCDLEDGMKINFLSSPALEGADSPEPNLTNRLRKGNWTQIFNAGIRVSGSELAVRKLAVADELDYQKQERLRELLRDLENTVINGAAANINKMGNATTARSMRGIVNSIETNSFRAGLLNASNRDLTEEMLNNALRQIWENSSSTIDTIVCGGAQKRRINSFMTAKRGYGSNDDHFRDMVSTYESDFGVCRVILSRYVQKNTILLLDSSKIDVMPLAGRSFHYKPLAATGDYEAGEVIGEYTMEFRNEQAHGMITELND